MDYSKILQQQEYDFLKTDEHLGKLLQAKMRMIESEKGRRIDEINEYIVSKLDYYKKLTDELPDDRKTELEPLNQLFLAVLRH